MSAPPADLPAQAVSPPAGVPAPTNGSPPTDLGAAADVRASTPAWLQRVVYFLPLILPLVVVITFLGFYKLFLLCPEHQACSPFTSAEIMANLSNSDQTRVDSYVARAMWTLINGVHLLACLTAIVAAGVVIDRALSEYSPAVRWTIILITIAAAADIALGTSLWTLKKDLLSPAQLLHQATIGKKDLPGISKYNRIAEAFSLTGALSLAAAACAILWKRDVNKLLDEADLKRRINLLRPVLYVGAAVLILGVIRLSATHGWAVSYLPPNKDITTTVSSLTSGIIGSLGTTYTLVIAGIYLPAILILRSRLNDVAPGQTDSSGWIKLVPKVIAIIGPFLAGPLGKLLINLANSLGGNL